MAPDEDLAKERMLSAIIGHCLTRQAFCRQQMERVGHVQSMWHPKRS